MPTINLSPDPTGKDPLTAVTSELAPVESSSILGSQAMDPEPMKLGMEPRNLASETLDAVEIKRRQDAASAQQKRKSVYLQKLDAALLDPDTFFKEHPIDPLFSGDPEAQKRLILTQASLRYHNGLRPITGGQFNRDLFRAGVSKREFGEIAKDDADYLARATTQAQGRKETKEVYGALGEAAMTAVAVDLGKHRNPSEKWAATRAEISKMPGFKNIPDADLQEAYYMMEKAAADEIAPFASELTEVFQSWEESTGAGSTTGSAKAILSDIFPGADVRRATPEDKKQAAEKSTRRTAYEIYDKLSPENQPKFMDAIGIMASKLPKEQRNGFFANVAQDSGRALESLAQGVVTNSEVNGMVTWADITGRSPEDSKTYWNAYDHRRRRADFVQKLQNLNEGTYNPTKKLSKSWLGQMGETIAYGTPGVLATSAAATNPYTGAALFSSLTETHYQSLLAATEGHMG